MRLSLKLSSLLLMMWFVTGLAQAKQQVIGDYHVTSYIDVQGSAEGFEAFTKQPDNRVFFGLSCSIQSPLPFIQMIMFAEDTLSESPKYMQASLKVDQTLVPIALNGVLSVVDNADEFSNKVRFEVATSRGMGFTKLQNDYQQVLTMIEQGKELMVNLKHRTMDEKTFVFSLKGLAEILKSNKSLCQ